ncbi:hypothetical protein MEO41_28245, partial [Dolichospermum sp. ST_sed4]|nr:hypothetical protein [Dolichospermum sp. ST_sed4]
MVAVKDLEGHYCYVSSIIAKIGGFTHNSQVEGLTHTELRSDIVEFADDCCNLDDWCIRYQQGASVLGACIIDEQKQLFSSNRSLIFNSKKELIGFKDVSTIFISNEFINKLLTQHLFRTNNSLFDTRCMFKLTDREGVIL